MAQYKDVIVNAGAGGFGFPLIVVEFVVTILKRMILPLFPLKTVCRMMWLIRYWKMSNQIYGSGQIGGWSGLIRNRRTCGYILLRMVC